MYTRILFIIGLLLCCSELAIAQSSFENSDSLIHQLYKVLSGPASEHDWELYKSLFHEKAILGAVRIDAQGNQTYSSFTPDEYVKRNDEFFRTNGFYVNEIHRVSDQFGDIMQLFSTYEFRVEGSGGVQSQQRGRGINSFQLIRNDNRWWIISLQFTNERPDLQIPKSYLKSK